MPMAKLSKVEMYYDETGSGEPLVVTTGWARAERAFPAQVAVLAQRYRCITHDHRLIGRTIAPDTPTSIAEMADDLAELLDHLSVSDARVLGGGGMGAIVALELAIRHPGKVRSLHLGSPCLKTDPFLTSLMKVWKKLRRLDPQLWAQEVTHWCFMPATFAERPELTSGAASSRAAEPTFPDHSCYDRIVDAYITHDVTATASGIRCPVQISNGGELDLITGPRMARAVHEAIPGSELVVFENASHGYFSEEPERFTELVVDWFART